MRTAGARRFLARSAILVLLLGTPARAVELEYAPAPLDNPLKGLVPYVSASGKNRFPHSMEFRYFPLDAVMTGPSRFDWSPIEKTLAEVNGRGNQLVFRIYCEYPGKGLEIPRFLVDQGVKVTAWKDDEGKTCHTPDWGDPVLRKALATLIAALGTKYDGDPRVAFITAGLLGKWGEWHDYPREELWAKKDVQREVMDAFAKAFTRTKILLRYPAGPKTYWHAENSRRPFGYHDDSFGWATLDTGKKKDSWFFEPSLKAAGATQKWKTFPIGGELRPELWKSSFTDRRHPRDQGFVKCVERTHASWLMDTGLFDVRIPMDARRKAAALKEVARLGYELYVSKAEWKNGELSVTLVNRGVAPFYHDWSVQVRAHGEKRNVAPKTWRLSEILPGPPVTWRVKIGRSKAYQLRVPNPMKGGKPLRFANKEQGKEWLGITLE